MHLFKRLALTAMILAALCLMIVSPAMAWEVIKSEENTNLPISLAQDRIVNDDLVMAGDDITVDGTVNGDLLVFGRSVTVNGTVKGDLIVFCSDLTINGNVEDDARLAAQNITVKGLVNGSLTAAANRLNVEKPGRVNGNVTLAMEKASISGPVQGRVLCYSGTLNIDSAVGRDVTAYNQGLTIGPAAVIAGKLMYTSTAAANISENAKISGGISHKLPPQTEKREPQEPTTASAVIWFLAGLVSNLLIWFIWRLISDESFDKFEEGLVESGWSAVAWGMLLFFIVPIAGLFLMFTVVGIPISLIAFLIYGLMLYLGKLLVGSWLGHMAAQKYPKPFFEEHPNLMPILGITVVMLLGLIPILGFWIRWLVGIMGLGCAFLYLRNLATQKVTE